MNRIIGKNAQLRKDGKKAFVAYITAGFPNLKTTKQLVTILEKSGTDFVELGMPFSDPVADGQTIQYSSSVALKKGMTVHKFLSLVKILRRSTQIPLIMMSYYNPILKFGIDKFARTAASCGLDGVIVPDLPPEEARQFNKALKQEGILQIFLISPVTEPQRIRKIVNISRGFVYYVTLTGVTGARDKLPDDLARHLRSVKRVTKTPVFAGFGISRPQQVRRIIRVVDGVIVGSAIISIIRKYHGKKDFGKKVRTYITSMSTAAHESGAGL